MSFPTFEKLGDGFVLVRHSARVAEIRRVLSREGVDGAMTRVRSAYFGFEEKADADTFARQIASVFPSADIFIRASERLNTAWEVKIRGIAPITFTEFMARMVKESAGCGDAVPIPLPPASTAPVVPTPSPCSSWASLAYRQKPTRVRSSTGRMVSID